MKCSASLRFRSDHGIDSGDRGIRGSEKRTDEAKLDKLSQERASGLDQLREKQVNLLADLTRQGQREVEDLIRERDAVLARLGRGIAQEQDLNAELAKNYTQAILAKAQQSAEDVRLGAPAVPVNRPLPRHILLYSLLAAAIGGVLGLVAVEWRELSVVRRIPPKSLAP